MAVVLMLAAIASLTNDSPGKQLEIATVLT